MRLRHIEGSAERLEAHESVITKIEELKGKAKALFGNDKPLHVEFGSGRGGYLVEMARQNPEYNYIGFERDTKVLTRGLNKFNDEFPENFKFAKIDAENVEDIFEESEIDRIYLNFSDPWPKARHSKRRLTHRLFLNRYKTILRADGEIHFKTDNDDLFEFSLEELEEMEWDMRVVTRDLHNSDHNEGNVMTEYEEKFSGRGKNINKVIAGSPKK